MSTPKLPKGVLLVLITTTTQAGTTGKADLPGATTSTPPGIRYWLPVLIPREDIPIVHTTAVLQSIHPPGYYSSCNKGATSRTG